MIVLGYLNILTWKWKNLSWLRGEAAAAQLKAAGVQAANLLEEPVDMLPPVNYSSQFEAFCRKV